MCGANEAWITPGLGGSSRVRRDIAQSYLIVVQLAFTTVRFFGVRALFSCRALTARSVNTVDLAAGTPATL